MKIKTLTLRSKARTEFIDITSLVQRLIDEEGIKHGICYLFVPHTTAGITINEGADPSVQRDIQTLLSRLAPQDLNYQHREGNADAHIKSTLVGMDKFVFIEDGRLVLGTWQALYFCEFDGPRHRRVIVKIVPDD